MLSPSGDHDGYSATVRALVGRVAAKIVPTPPLAGTVPICATSASAVLVSSAVTLAYAIVLPSGDHAGSAPVAPSERLPVPSVFMPCSGPTPESRSAGSAKTIWLPSFGLKSAVNPAPPPGTAVADPPADGTVNRLLVLLPSGFSVSRVKTIVLPSGDHAGKVSTVVVRESAGPVTVPVVSRRKPLPSRLTTMSPGWSVGAADAEPW